MPPALNVESSPREASQPSSTPKQGFWGRRKSPPKITSQKALQPAAKLSQVALPSRSNSKTSATFSPLTAQKALWETPRPGQGSTGGSPLVRQGSPAETSEKRGAAGGANAAQGKEAAEEQHPAAKQSSGIKETQAAEDLAEGSSLKEQLKDSIEAALLASPPSESAALQVTEGGGRGETVHAEKGLATVASPSADPVEEQDSALVMLKELASEQSAHAPEQQSIQENDTEDRDHDTNLSGIDRGEKKALQVQSLLILQLRCFKISTPFT